MFEHWLQSEHLGKKERKDLFIITTIFIASCLIDDFCAVVYLAFVDVRILLLSSVYKKCIKTVFKRRIGFDAGLRMLLVSYNRDVMLSGTIIYPQRLI